MKNNIFFKAVSCLLAVSFLFSLAACGKKDNELPPISTDFPQPAPNPYTLSALPSEKVTLTAEAAQAVLSLASQPTDYPYSAHYQLDEVKKRLNFDASVASHSYNALDNSGNLTGAHLAELVKANNEAFLAEKSFGYENVEDGNILMICDFIVEIMGRMVQRHPDIDWTRVFCNLGNLKILYKNGLLSYAEVNDKMIMSISKHSANIANVLVDENGYSLVIVHEIMHIIQMGCSCEQIENCSRRAGICTYYDDFSLNFTDWTWMAEGSAERHMCTLTGGEAISYQYKMDYICSFDFSVLLRSETAADTIENLCFYDDPQLLFDAFGCQTEQERDEVLNMMITMQILQMQPVTFYEEYKKATGIQLDADEESLNQLSYSLKPAVCITLAKEFYQNLVPFLQENQVTCNDLFFLLALFEGHLNQHLDYASEEKAHINQTFISFYQQLREALFTALQTDNPQLDIPALYENYTILSDGQYCLNGDLSMLPEDKRAFLTERARWQGDLLDLGVTVPVAETAPTQPENEN